MKNLKANELVNGFYHFGNKGAVWSNETHIAKSGDSGTLCGTPMLSSNWARIENHPEIGCQKCLSKYSDLNVIPREPKHKFTRPALWFCKGDEVTMSKINKYFTDECFNQLVKYGYIIPANE